MSIALEAGAARGVARNRPQADRVLSLPIWCPAGLSFKRGVRIIKARSWPAAIARAGKDIQPGGLKNVARAREDHECGWPSTRVSDRSP